MYMMHIIKIFKRKINNISHITFIYEILHCDSSYKANMMQSN